MLIQNNVNLFNIVPKSDLNYKILKYILMRKVTNFIYFFIVYFNITVQGLRYIPLIV